MNPMRPELYNRLKTIFKHVTICNPGAEFRSHVIKINGRSSRDIDSYGETYRVNCPYCGDEYKRLYISHMWGKIDPETGFRNLSLAHCFNETCTRFQLNRQETLWYDIMEGVSDNDVVHLGSEEAAENKVGFAWPGTMHSLLTLPNTHHAIKYLNSRDFDVREIVNLYGVSYCSLGDENLKFGYATDKIICPVLYRDQPVGWQARFIGNPPDKRKEGGKKLPKYLTMRGFSCGSFLYNYDLAKKFSYVVVCEGVTDVWRFGPEAVCLFGKSISARQLALLSEWPNIVLMLDATPDIEEGNNIETAEESLQKLRSSKYVTVKLPSNMDPGKMDRQVMRDMVFGTMNEKGLLR